MPQWLLFGGDWLLECWIVRISSSGRAPCFALVTSGDRVPSSLRIANPFLAGAGRVMACKAGLTFCFLCDSDRVQASTPARRGEEGNCETAEQQTRTTFGRSWKLLELYSCAKSEFIFIMATKTLTTPTDVLLYTPNLIGYSRVLFTLLSLFLMMAFPRYWLLAITLYVVSFVGDLFGKYPKESMFSLITFSDS